MYWLTLAVNLSVRNQYMRTNFFIALFVLLSASVFAQNNKAKVNKPKSAPAEKLQSPDMSVLNGNSTRVDKKDGSKPSDTTNIIPLVDYSRLSFGVNYGVAFYTGDVPMDAIYPGFGGFVKYSFNHTLGIRAQYLNGEISGRNRDIINIAKDSLKFHSNISNITLQVIFNIGGIDYRKSFPRNNFYLGFGGSFQFNNAKRESPDSSIYTDMNFGVPITIGVKRKVLKNFDIGIEGTYILGGSDLIDLYKAPGSLPDANGYVVASIVYNITTKKRPQHMDWSNPIDKIYRDLMDAKGQAEGLTTDTDGDGVADMNDQEPNTQPGYKVDSKGVTLDSDKDGIPDTIDPDPYGFGQALGLYFPDFKGTKDSMEKIYKINDSIPIIDFVAISKSGYGLPTITFPPNGFTVHVEQYNLLNQIARILMIDTSASVVIIGHADNNKPNLTQLTLAEKRALEVKRKLFRIYEIEENRLLVFAEKDPYVQKYQLSTEGLNRKVEFKIIRPKK